MHRFDLCHDFSAPQHPNNDRLILSKGHASALLYALYKAVGAISDEELMTFGTLGSRLEGHPVRSLPWIDVATGSLGQGLCIGVGMALSACHSNAVKGAEGYGAFIHDPLAVAAALDRSLVTTEALYVDVETAGELTAGMTVADRRRLTGNVPNLDVAQAADIKTFLDRLIERVGGLAADHPDVSR